MKKAIWLVIIMAVALIHFASAVTGSDYVDVQVQNLRLVPYPVEPGQYFTIYFELYNNGNLEASNVVFTLTPKYPFSLEPADNPTTVISGLPGGSRRLVQYRVRVAPDAIDGANDLGYTLTYNNVQGGKTSFSVPVTRKNNLRITSVTPTRIKPGVETQLTFTLSNIGNATAQGITLSWSEPSGLIIPLGSENRRDIVQLGPGEKQDVTFDVIADPSIAPGAYLLTANVSYAGGNSTASFTSKTGVVVGGDADLEVSVQDYTQGQLSIAIANTGTNPAAATSVTIPRQPGVTVTGASTQFIGNLQRGDFTLATFQIQQTAVDAGVQATPSGGRQGRLGGGNFTGGAFRGNFSASANEVMVQVAYTNTLGERKTIMQAVQLTTGGALATGAGGFAGRSGQQANATPWYYYAGGAVVLIAVGWLAHKRFKKKLPAVAAQTHAKQERH
jgi:hypothetical protein